MPGMMGVVQEVPTGENGKDPDILVRTDVDTIETERAVEVARLLRKVQIQLTAGEAVVAADAVLGPAGLTDVRVADLHFQRRNRATARS